MKNGNILQQEEQIMYTSSKTAVSIISSYDVLQEFHKGEFIFLQGQCKTGRNSWNWNYALKVEWVGFHQLTRVKKVFHEGSALSAKVKKFHVTLQRWSNWLDNKAVELSLFFFGDGLYFRVMKRQYSAVTLLITQGFGRTEGGDIATEIRSSRTPK